MATNLTLRSLRGLGNEAAPVSETALIIIDAQNAYLDGLLRLEGIEAAMAACQHILARYRDAGRPIVHIQHEGAPGSPFDLESHSGQIADQVAPRPGEAVIRKRLPSSFTGTSLHEHLQAEGINRLMLVGFMSHMCVNSTARAAVSLGYEVSVVAAATATRALPSPLDQSVIPAAEIHRSALAALADAFAAVVPTVADVPENPSA